MSRNEWKVFGLGRKVAQLDYRKLTLRPGCCYTMSLVDKTSITFRFVGTDNVGRILVRTPPNSDRRTALEHFIGEGYTSCAEVECPAYVY